MKDQPCTPDKVHTSGRVCRFLQVLVLSAFLTGIAHAQVTGDATEEARKAVTLQTLDYLKQGVYGPVTEEQLANAGMGQLVSVLQDRFVNGQDSNIKAAVAKAVVQLGEKDGPYWDYLVRQATLAIESDAPSPRCFSSSNCVSGHPAEYVAWARNHGVTEGSPAEMALDWLEGKVSLISGDPRGIPLLRQALKSPYREIVEVAADGLARAHDKDSIPLIVIACKQFDNPDEVRLIANSLRRFERVPEARAAAEAAEDQCLPPPDPMEALKRNDSDSMPYIGTAVATHPAETIAILKRNFVTNQDQRQKAQIASSLIGLGDKEEIYWDFLLRQAISALESVTSSTVKYDLEGKPIESPSSEDAWKKQDAIFNTVLLFVETVAETPEPRGIEILRRSLSSPNLNIQSLAAAGLVRAQDKDSIPLIIDVCKTSSPDVAQYFASEVLVYFDDPRAQSAVDQYLSKEDANMPASRRLAVSALSGRGHLTSNSRASQYRTAGVLGILPPSGWKTHRPKDFDTGPPHSRC